MRPLSVALRAGRRVSVKAVPSTTESCALYTPIAARRLGVALAERAQDWLRYRDLLQWHHLAILNPRKINAGDNMNHLRPREAGDVSIGIL